ncbi:hypothetical protein N7508_006434 [Penicillium antarcticum]|uniref:uncharacterized protein n=1 Tax=Penicillium antarcticum TaxID=416450 RepID=UPI00239000E2|nr:uncharacterized protein N7508_006434 [Penicillium antarcticum]KAJ5301571.1 hypothetical protein N7508_006434 [Penicillium antarcticum]
MWRQFTLGIALAAVPFGRALSPRTDINDAYDFVIVGGGQAGLVLGGRLSEDTNHTVLVLEAGGDGDEYRERIDTPAYSYFDSLWTTPLNWMFYTHPQPNAYNREIYWPRGKTLGGSSAINGLYMTRPGKEEINAWQDMLDDMDGNENWSWDSFYTAMKKSETFSTPTDDVVKEAGITWNASTHGADGPIHMSYPGYTFPEVGYWSTSLDNLGIAISENMYGGDVFGAEVSTSCINPSNWTRSYSRTGYLDPLPDRGNYDVLANAHVTRLVFDKSSSSDNLTASAVEYTMDNGTTTLSVKVNKEVILASGSIGSPAVLLYSGIGPKDVLSDAGVDLVSELPGVGQHLQDHFSATVTFSTDADTAGSIYYDNGADKDSTLFKSYIDSAIAYVNATGLYGDNVSTEETSILSHLNTYKPNTTYSDSVIAGYETIYNTTAKTIFSSPIGQIELLFMNSDANGDIGISAALQHPYSHGRIYINSSDPMNYPVIDPNYLANPADMEILLQGLKLARQLGQTSPLSGSLTNETSPGISIQSDADWTDWIRNKASTEFHPSSSCAMLPREKGGVVDAKLRVYGLSNVRVADASVPPIALSTHLMASTYGVAELASVLIRDFWNGLGDGDASDDQVVSPAFSGNRTSTVSTVSTAAAAQTTKKNGAGSIGGADPGGWLMGVALHVFALAVFV